MTAPESKIASIALAQSGAERKGLEVTLMTGQIDLWPIALPQPGDDSFANRMMVCEGDFPTMNGFERSATSLDVAQNLLSHAEQCAKYCGDTRSSKRRGLSSKSALLGSPVWLILRYALIGLTQLVSLCWR